MMLFRRLTAWKLDELEQRLLGDELKLLDLADAMVLVKESFLSGRNWWNSIDYFEKYTDEVNAHFGYPLMSHLRESGATLARTDFLCLNLQELLFLRENGMRKDERSFLRKAWDVLKLGFQDTEERERLRRLGDHTQYCALKGKYPVLFQELEGMVPDHFEFRKGKEQLSPHESLAVPLYHAGQDWLLTKVREQSYDQKNVIVRYLF